MRDAYRVEWLQPLEARAVARLERRVYGSGERVGRVDIFEDLTEAETEGRNLSLGLYLANTLVGYALIFLEEDRRHPASYLGIDLDAPNVSGPGIFFADYAVHPRHRKVADLLTTRFAANVAARRLQNLPVDAFCTDTYAAHWGNHPRFLARLGLRLAATYPCRDRELNRSLYWLTFAPQPRKRTGARGSVVAALKFASVGVGFDGAAVVGVIDNEADWALLEPHWDRLLRLTPGYAPFQSYLYLRTWWKHIGWIGTPYLVVVLRDGNPAAIAPLQINRTRWLGRELRCLGFMGQPTEVDRPTVLMDRADALGANLIADFLMQNNSAWDCVVLQEQPAQGSFLSALSGRLRSGQYVVTLVNSQDCRFTTIDGTWEAFLRTKGRALRRSLKRKTSNLAVRGRVLLEKFNAGDQAESELKRYVDVEDASWKANAGLGAARSCGHLGFYEDVARRLGPTGNMCFRFLTVEGQTIAGTFGLLFDRRYYSLHIAHDEAWASHSPGFVLTAMELEDAFTERAYAEFDFLGGFPTNKRAWSSGTVSTVALYADRASVRGRLFHFGYFQLKPALRRGLARIGVLEPLLRAKRELLRRFSRNRRQR